MIEFTYPWMFATLILPFFITWIFPAYKEKKESIQVPFFRQLVKLTNKKPEVGAVILNRRTIQKLILILAWIAIVIALAKPQIIGPAVVQQKSARDLLIAVDLSGSMSVEDFTTIDNLKINRLVAVKHVLTEFVNERQKDRLGLIVFGDAPYLQAPLSESIDTWLTLLNETQIGMAGQSTAFGDAIGLSISVFNNSKTKNKVLIVLTDGNDTASKVPPVEAAKIAASENIKIYTIAIGDPSAVGEDKVDIKVLQDIAIETGGKSYQAINRQELKNVYKEINLLEPELFDRQSFHPKTSIHFYPIIIFSLLYLISLSIVIIRHKIANKEVI